MDIAVGIDIGTSGVRAVAMDHNGVTIAKTEAPMPAPIRIDGHLRQDARIWLAALSETLEQLGIAVDFHRVAAIAVDGTSGTILPIDAAGSPLALASMYNDTAQDGDIATVAAVAPQDTAARGASSPLARALAMQEIPGIKRIVHQADWIAGQLCGEFTISDENNSLKTGYDPLQRRWPEWIAGCGLDTALLP